MPTLAWLVLAPLLFFAPQAHQTATLLDAAEWRGRSYVCVETADRILIGQKRGGAARMKALTGKPVLVRQDDKRLWVNGAKFTQDYLTQAFPAGSRCAGVIEGAIARRDSTEPKQLRTR